MRNKLFKNQVFHLFFYLLIGAGLYLASMQMPDSNQKIWGLTAHGWLLISWIFAGMMQLWIVTFWRMEFYLGKISKWFGSSGFTVFRLGFIIFGTARFLSVLPISYLTTHSLQIPQFLRLTILIGTTPFILWGIYSVFFYFSVNRAFGADHFYPKYRNGSLEIRGIFKYIPNSMYTVVLLVLYHPGFLWYSQLGLVTALAHHCFVWVHYFCTEKPDMKEIYG